MEITQKNQSQEELTARQIFDKIIKGQIVRIPYDPILAHQLKNHLNVIKSREKKLFASLGLDFISSIIYVFPVDQNPSKHPLDELLPVAYEIKMVAPKTRRKYPAFSIEESELPDANPL